ncbi:hypothetical protein ABZT17_41525 [Streptomyces sp. NPDC005648]|uniref:hypothetical protein n=1 Tax=Streptomyces sp. NPDC005648 TaxID=3157044 RepID=UPI0033A67D5E
MPKVIAERGNLPAAITSFVGRRQETAEIRRLLCVRRLVTLSGMGGVGKTRPALEVAAASREEFADGVWLVDLVPVSDPSAVAATAAGALRVPDLGALPFLDQLTGCLAGRRALLVTSKNSTTSQRQDAAVRQAEPSSANALASSCSPASAGEPERRAEAV